MDTGANLEKLIVSGSGVINETGNALASTITGNTAGNLLSGGSGNDTAWRLCWERRTTRRFVPRKQ